MPEVVLELMGFSATISWSSWDSSRAQCKVFCYVSQCWEHHLEKLDQYVQKNCVMLIARHLLVKH